MTRGLRLTALAALVAGCGDAPASPTCPSGLPPMPSAVPVPSASAALDATLPDDRAPLAFVNPGKPRRSLAKEELRAGVSLESFTIAADGYYGGRPKTWRAIPLRTVLERGFGEPAAELEGRQFVLRCADGYTVPLEGKRLLEEGGYLALADAEVPGWEPVEPKRDNPGPYFVAWRGKAQQDLEMYPRPYQLVAIEVASFETTFPRVLPDGEPAGSPAHLGLALFKEQCLRCHAINRQGGRVGPELNVPRSVIEYRDERTLRAFVKNPREFRYSAMPSHPHLTERDLDHLLAYLRAMSKRKHDPEAAPATVGARAAGGR